MESQLEKQLTHLESLNLNELREEWGKVSNKPLPKISSTEFLRYHIAWTLQERALGGLSGQAKRRLKDLHERFENNPDFNPSQTFHFKPGTVLTRIWNGTRHDVLVEEVGFKYQNQNFQNLSEIATQITGSRWSGPVFFGLKEHPGKRNRNGKTNP